VRIALLAALAFSAAILVAGCGTVGRAPASADVGTGKSLFVQKCASCHALADADAKGTVGPNLDHSLGEPRAQGFDDSTIRDVVLGQMAYASPPMPREDALFPECTDKQSAGTNGCVVDQLEALHAVAAYVTQVAGKPVQGKGVPATPLPGG
jgi:hypothetical protein